MSQTPFSLNAIDLETGVVRWTVTMPDGQVVRDIAALSGAVLLRTVVEGVHRLVCFDGWSGLMRWEVDLPGAAVSRLRFISDTVAVASMPLHLVAYEPVDGSVRWDSSGAVRASTDSESWCEDGHPVFDEAVELAEAPGVYLVGTRKGMLAFAAATGDLLWESSLGTVETMHVQGDSAFVVDMQNHLHRLLIETGESVWSFECNVDEDVNPVVAEDVVFVRTDADDLHALETSDGGIRWSRNFRGISAFGQSASGRTFVSTFFGGLHCLDLATGEPLWDLEFGKVRPGPQVVRSANNGCLVSVLGELRLHDAITGSELQTFKPGSSWWLMRAPAGQDFAVILEPGLATRLSTEDLSVSWSAPFPDTGHPALDMDPVVVSEGSVFVVGPGS